MKSAEGLSGVDGLRTTEVSEREQALDDAIHALAQPLTSLLFLVEIARLQADPDAWRTALDSARDECRRAVAALDQVRTAVQMPTGVAPMTPINKPFGGTQ